VPLHRAIITATTVNELEQLRHEVDKLTGRIMALESVRFDIIELCIYLQNLEARLKNVEGLLGE